MDQGVSRLTLVRSLSAIAALAMLAVPAWAQVEFRPQGGGFRVDFPAAPRVTNELASTRFGNTRSITAELERPGAKFYAIYTDYPEAAAAESPQSLLDGIRVGRTVKGNIRAEQRFQIEGSPAQREVVDWHVGTRPVIVALDVLRGLRLYSVFCIVDRGQENGAEVRRFFDSFMLLPL